MNLDLAYPAISDLKQRAKRRLPHFAFEYLDSSAGSELGPKRNREALDAIRFMPAILRGEIKPELKRRFLGRDYSLPIGIAPVGMAGMVWPGAERKLAQVAAERRIPVGLSTVAAATPEEIGPHAGEMGWFQFYPAADPEIRRDILRRAKEAGFNTLVLTVDVPGEARRERQRRAALVMPFRLTPSILLAMLRRPAWTLGVLREGRPAMKLPASYMPKGIKLDAFNHPGRLIRGFPDWDYLKAIRELWDGDLIVKGVLDPEDAVRLTAEGVDAIWVSNHTGRQFEAGPTAIEQLPKVRAALGPEAPIVFDSGVSGGLDILRALALGADFVMLGRAFYYALAAFDQRGVRHLLHILEADMRANMAQIGAHALADLPARLLPLDAPAAGA